MWVIVGVLTRGLFKLVWMVLGLRWLGKRSKGAFYMALIFHDFFGQFCITICIYKNNLNPVYT